MPPREVTTRRPLKWAALLVLLAVIAYGVDRDARTRAASASAAAATAEGHKICPLLEALWPKHADEVPTSPYGTRIVKAVRAAAQVYDCTLPTLPGKG